MKTLAQHPVAAQILAEDDSLQLMLPMIALGGTIPMLSHSDSFKKIAATTPPLCLAQLHRHVVKVLASSASILFARLKMLWIVCAPLFGKVVQHLTLNPKPLCIGLQRLIVFLGYWWMFQILRLLLTSDNGSIAKYIETHELVCVRTSLFLSQVLIFLQLIF
jgi:hypothetical protein